MVFNIDLGLMPKTKNVRLVLLHENLESPCPLIETILLQWKYPKRNRESFLVLFRKFLMPGLIFQVSAQDLSTHSRGLPQFLQHGSQIPVFYPSHGHRGSSILDKRIFSCPKRVMVCSGINGSFYFCFFSRL